MVSLCLSFIVLQAKYTSATKNSESKSSRATAPNDAKGKKKTLATVVHTASYKFDSDPSNMKCKHVDSGLKNTTKKQIPMKQQKKTHNSEDNRMGEEDRPDGDDEGDGDGNNDNDNSEEEVVDPVAQYEAMQESIQKECHVSSNFFLINLLILVRLLANIPIEDKMDVLRTYRQYILLEQWWLMASNIRVIGARFAGKFLLFHLP